MGRCLCSDFWKRSEVIWHTAWSSPASSCTVAVGSKMEIISRISLSLSDASGQSDCVNLLSLHQTEPECLHYSGLPSEPSWSPSRHVGRAGWDPAGTSLGCTEIPAPSRPSLPLRRRWLEDRETSHTTFSGAQDEKEKSILSYNLSIVKSLYLLY